jgi:drug/metabolite transporter (DMT)-like permease
MAIAWLAFREPVGPRILVGAALIVVGAALVAWSGPAGFSAGAFLIVAACLAWAVDNNLTRRISAADPVQIAAIKGLAAGAVNLSIAFASGAALPGPSATAAALAVGLAGYGVSLVMFVLALRHVGAARAGAYFSTAPFIGATFGVLFLGESASVGLVAGGVLIAAGVVIHLVEHHEHEHVHGMLDHDHRHSHDDHHRHGHSPSDPEGEPHAHRHRHEPMIHRHPHMPDIHHRHRH